MSSFPELKDLRLGCVRYLNARPLIHTYPRPVVFEHPSVLASLLGSDQLDLALIPIFEVIRSGNYKVVDQVAIASLGPVYSVFLAYTGNLSQVKKIKRDPASLTSLNLLQVILKEFHGIKPEMVEEGENGGDDGAANGDLPARLLIGNQAIDFRKLMGERYQYLDLGEEWTRQTGLPFVFAAWALRPEVPSEAADGIRRLKAESLADLESIIASESDPVFARDYLTHKIRFDLGEGEKRAIELFALLLRKHGQCEPSSASPEYV